MVWCNGQTFLNCRTPFPPIDIIFLCCTVVKVASRFKIFPDRGVTRWPWIQNLCNSVILDVSTWNKNGNVGHNNGSVIYPNIISVSYWYSEILASTQSPIAISSVCPSVCPSVCLSVCPSHLFDYVPIILSSRNFQELSPRTRVTSMQKVKVRGQRSRSQRLRPKFLFPDCNSSLKSHMMMKWYI